MPTPGQPTNNDAADLLDFDNQEWQSLVTERRRTDSDKSNLGIPADDDNFFQGLNIGYDPSTDFLLPSQASFCQGSWETVSATSHGTAHSFQEPIYGQCSQPRWAPLPIEIGQPRITLNDSSTYPNNASNTNRTRPDAGSPIDESRFPDHGAYSQTLADSSDPLCLTPHTSSPDPDNVYVDSQWMGYLDSANRTDPAEVQDHSLACLGTEFVQTSPIESSVQTEHLYRDFRQLGQANIHGGNPQVAIEAPRAPALDCKQAPDASFHGSQTVGSQRSAGPQASKKQQTPPRRENLDKINSVRKSGACIRCAVLHEPVSYKVLVGQKPSLTGLTKCDTGDPCATCKSNSQKAKIWRQPCVRLPLSAAEVHRTSKCTLCRC